ncbi:multidrug effflux MFS transporter [Alkalibacillus almallahensis]|uniref:multidrug effflux MFS transporter n=1 Tax=Alkalibacillus almallahensis TaxID=1379154 RepID=UPI00141EB052|nr:multidrug effflux MFS transporter [Alkalibacillus almallahensis]NIK11445.1 DHA1 family bicyclomycin/chloramphenicol resistance-like MFS transporter [Alkalibacillus almallahensis]
MSEQKTNLRLLLMLGAFTALVPLTIDLYLPAFPEMSGDLGTTASLIQLSLTTSLFGIAFGQLTVGALSDIFGRKKPLIISISIYVIASIVCAIAPNVWVLVVARFVQGFSGAGGIVISRSIIRDLYSGKQLTKMFSLLVLVMGLAPILAPMLGGQILLFTGWRGLFTILSIVGIILTFIAVFRLRESLPQEERSSGGLKSTVQMFTALIKHRRYMGFALIQGFASAAMFSYISGSSFILQDIFNLSPQVYAMLFGMNAVGFISMSQVVGRYSGVFSEEKLLAAGFVVAITGGSTLVTASLIDGGLVMVAIGFFCLTSSTGLINPTSLSLAMQTQDKNAGSASALLGLFQFVFGGLAAPLVGLFGTDVILPLATIVLTSQIFLVVSYLAFVKQSKTA